MRGQLPPGPREPPEPLWGPACQFLPSAKSSPRAQLGGVWAVRPAWDICSRQSRIKGERWGRWGLRTNPSIPSRYLLSRPQAAAAGDRTQSFFLSPWEKRANREGQVRISLLPSSVLLLNQMPHLASLLEGNRALRPRGSCPGFPGGAGAQDTTDRPGAERIPLAAN